MPRARETRVRVGTPCAQRRRMALVAPLFAFIGRQIGRIIQTAFGWASVMLFGRVPQKKQLLLAGVSAASIAWVVALIGIAFPGIGTWLVALVPRPDFIDEGWIRLAMLILAVILPLGVGAGGLFLMDATDRPEGVGGKVVQALRGYPYAAVLALVLLGLLLIAPVFKVRTIIKRWEDAHIPIVVKPGRYEEVAAELEKAIDAAGLDLQRGRAPRVLEIPSRILATVGGESVRRLVPDELVMLRAKSLEVTIHPSDVAVAGTKEAVARARAAIADRLTKTEAYLTTSEEGQEIEDALRELRADTDPESVRMGLHVVDEQLASLVIAYDEWEVLYRQRLQCERDFLRGARAADSDAMNDRAAGPLQRVVEAVERLIS